MKVLKMENEMIYEEVAQDEFISIEEDCEGFEEE